MYMYTSCTCTPARLALKYPGRSRSVELISIYLSVYLSVYLSIDRSIDLSIDRSIDRSIDLSIYLSICIHIDISMLVSISFHLSIYQSDVGREVVLARRGRMGWWWGTLGRAPVASLGLVGRGWRTVLWWQSWNPVEARSSRGVNPTHTEPPPDTAGGKHHKGGNSTRGNPPANTIYLYKSYTCTRARLALTYPGNRRSVTASSIYISIYRYRYYIYLHTHTHTYIYIYLHSS